MDLNCPDYKVSMDWLRYKKLEGGTTMLVTTDGCVPPYILFQSMKYGIVDLPLRQITHWPRRAYQRRMALSTTASGGNWMDTTF